MVASIEVIRSCLKAKSAWAHVRVSAKTGNAEVVVKRQVPSFMAANGELASSSGFSWLISQWLMSRPHGTSYVTTKGGVKS